MQFGRLVSVIVGLVGLVVFSTALVMISTQQDAVEAQVQRFAVYKVEQGTRQALDEREDSGSVEKAMQRLALRYDNQAIAMQTLADRIPLLVATILQDRCKGECPEAEIIEDIALAVAIDAALRLEVKGTTLRQFVLERYDATVANLVEDLKIFSLVNAISFAMVLLLSTVRRAQIARRILPLTIMLVVSVSIASWSYLFGQDWFATLLLNDFVGWAYAVWIALILLFLIDIGFLRGRITRLVMDAFAAMLTALPF